jgi:hypothetical protein
VGVERTHVRMERHMVCAHDPEQFGSICAPKRAPQRIRRRFFSWRLDERSERGIATVGRWLRAARPAQLIQGTPSVGTWELTNQFQAPTFGGLKSQMQGLIPKMAGLMHC